MAKKICISGYYGFNNFGDELILKILVQNLKHCLNSAAITVFSVNPAITSQKLDVESVNTFKLLEIINSIKNTDFLISGGGSLLQDVSSCKSLIYYLFVLFTAFVFRKKIIIFAQGIGPINNFLLRKLTFFILKQSFYITVRDEKSLKLLLDNNINAKLCADPVWNISAVKQENEKNIGIQLRDFSFINDNFIFKLAQNINKYYFNKNIYIFSLQNKIDLRVCEKLKSVLKRINPQINIKLTENFDNDKIIQDICSMNTLISMRYHACLIGIKACIKVLPINYDIKVKTLTEKYNLTCINSVEDMDEAFKIFETSSIDFDKIKQNIPKFDFSELKKVIENKIV